MISAAERRIDPNARKWENESYRQTKENSEGVSDHGCKRVLFKEDSYGWKRAFIQSKKTLWLDRGSAHREVWKTDEAIRVDDEEQARMIYHALRAAASNSKTTVEYEKVYVAYRKKNLSKNEYNAYRFGRWLRMKGWKRLGTFVKNVFAPDADSVLNPPTPA